ncbi:MAG: HDOD domain-containing protein [Campylobacterota bacterium]
MENIKDLVEVLPNPNSELYELFLLKDEKLDMDKLIRIVEKNPFLVNRVLYLANSRYFGFSYKIHSPSKAINLYGINFCVSICISQLVIDSLKFDLKAYSMGFLEFRRHLDISLKFIFEFLDESEAWLKEELIIPLFLQHIGKFIISSYLQIKAKMDYFKTQADISSIHVAEYKATRYNSNEISYEILKKWGFPNNYLEDINSTIDTKNYKTTRVTQALNIVNTLFELKNTLTETSISTTISKIKEYDFDLERFKKLVTKYRNEYYKADLNG